MRIFLAVRFPDEMKNELSRVMGELRAQGVDGVYTGPENLHLTLAFIGETSQLREIRAAVRETAVTPFSISLGGLGRFHDLLWLGVTGEKELRALAQEVRQALFRHGISHDEKPFKAHITLVRKAGVRDLPHVEIAQTGMTVSRISVMKSERIGGKLIYTEL